jgi:hypothetical protein
MPGFGQPYPGADQTPPAGHDYRSSAGDFGRGDPGRSDFGSPGGHFGGSQYGDEPGRYGEHAGGYGGAFGSADQPLTGEPEHDFGSPEVRPPYEDDTMTAGQPFEGAAEPGYEHGTGAYGSSGSGYGSPDYYDRVRAGTPPAPPDVPVGPYAPPSIDTDPSRYLAELRDRRLASTSSYESSAVAGPDPTIGARTGAVRSAPRTARMPRPSVGTSVREDPNGREASVTVSRVEPMSVLKFSFVMSVVAFIVLFVGVAVLYGALAGLGVFDSLQRTISSLTSGQGASGVDAGSWFSASRILGYAALFGALNIVLITALSTIGAVLYNAAARLIGGVEVTLNETE